MKPILRLWPREDTFSDSLSDELGEQLSGPTSWHLWNEIGRATFLNLREYDEAELRRSICSELFTN